MNLVYGDLRADDARPLWPWLSDQLRWHLRGWVDAVGLPWTDAQIDARISSARLVYQEWGQLQAHAADPRAFVLVARDGDTPVGLLCVEVRQDRYLGVRLAVVSVLHVAAAQRDKGIAGELLSRGRAWARDQGCALAEVFVSASNAPARSVYGNQGFVVADLRLLANWSDDEPQAD